MLWWVSIAFAEEPAPEGREKLRQRVFQIFDEAMAMAEKSHDSSRRSGALYVLTVEMAKVDVDRAVKVAMKNENPYSSADALLEAARELVKINPESALEVVRKIPESELLRFLGITLKRLDEKLKEKWLYPAEKWARDNFDAFASAKAEILWQIAENIGKTDKERAITLLEQGITTAEKIIDPYRKYKSLLEILVKMAEVDVQRALEWADEVSDPEAKDEALHKISSDLTKVDVPQALAISDKIANPTEKSLTLVEIASELMKTDKTSALALLEKATAIAEEIKYPQNKVEVYSDIASQLAEMEPGRALSLFEVAIHIAENEMYDGWRKDYAFSVISRGLSRVDIGRALEVSEKITALNEKAETLESIAIQAVRTSPDLVLEIVEQMPEFEPKPASWLNKDGLLSSLARKAARVNLSLSLQVVEKIPDPYWKNLSWVEIAEPLAEVDLRKALDIVEKVVDPGWKADVFHHIANRLVDRQPDLAVSFYERALIEARKLENEKDTAMVSRFIASDLARVDVERAIEIAEKITMPGWKAWAFYDIAMKVLPKERNRGLSLLEQSLKLGRQRENPDILARVASALWQVGAGK